MIFRGLLRPEAKCFKHNFLRLCKNKKDVEMSVSEVNQLCRKDLAEFNRDLKSKRVSRVSPCVEGDDAVDSNTDVEDVGLSADTHDTAKPPEEYWFTPKDEEAV